MLKIKPVPFRFAILLVIALVIAGCGGDSSSTAPPATWFVPEGSSLTASQMTSLFDTNQLHFNVQSAANGNGEIRGEITPSPTIFSPDTGNPFAPNPSNNPVTYAAFLEGSQVRPRNIVTNASGYGSVTLNPVTKQLTGFIVTSGIAGNAAQINDGLPGTSGPIIATLEGGPVVWTVPANTVLTDAQIARLSAGACYFNILSDTFPGGELRGQLNQQVRFASMKGANVVTPVTTSASGVGILALNPSVRQFSGFIKAAGFDSAVTSVFIRLGDAVTNGPGIVKLVNSGNGIWSIPIINNPVLNDFIIAAYNSDLLYVDIRTLANPGGELRGQIVKADVKIGTAHLDGFKEISPVSTQATGSGKLAWNSVTQQVSGSVKTDKVNGTAATILAGPATTNGPSLITLTTTSPVTVAPTAGVSFALDIQPIFFAKCAVPTCHVTGGTAPMSLETSVSYANIAELLIPGDSASSYFYQRITINDPPSFPRMPLNRLALNFTMQSLLKNWIDNGALNN